MPVNPNPATAATPIVSDPAAPLANDGPTSTNDGTTVVMPTIEAPAFVRAVGEEIIDEGEDAELVILHARVGTFSQGDRVAIADLGPNVDLDRLVRLNAVQKLEKAAPPSEAPAKPKK